MAAGSHKMINAYNICMEILSVLRELKNKDALKGDFEEDKNILSEHSRDASVFEIMPQLIFYPKNTKDIQLILKTTHDYYKEHKDDPVLSITVRAGGTCMSGGSLTPGLVLNLTRYMKGVEVVAEDAMYVEMGAMFRDVAKIADGKNKMFAPYPSSKDICGIGGMIGNNASGEKSVRFGATIDNIMGLEVVLADGTIIYTGDLGDRTDIPLASLLKSESLKSEILSLHQKVHGKIERSIGRVKKVASGYRLERIGEMGADLTPIFVGAQGTLGVVTKAVLKLVPKPAHTQLIVASVDSIDKLPFILQTIMKHNPECVETFDVNTFDRAKKLLKNETKMCQQFFSKGISLVVMAEFSEFTKKETDTVAKATQRELVDEKIKVEFVDDADVYESIWKIRRSSFGVMRDYNEAGFRAVPCIEDIIAPIDSFDSLVPALTALIKKYNLQYGFHGHIGDGSLRIVPVFDFRRGGDIVAEEIINFTREVVQLVKSLDGNISADHSDGIIRTPFLREFYGEEIFEAFVKIKLLFDPRGILNRGKKIGGTEETIKKYILKS